MSILTIGDIHCQLKNFNIIDQLQNQILSLIKKNKYKFIVLLGDLLHNHEKIHTLELNKIISFIHSLSQNIKIFILVGNHDMISNQEHLSDNNWMYFFKLFNINNVIIVNKPIKFEEYLFVPYVYPGKFIETLNNEIDNWKNSKIIFAHQELNGSKYGNITSSKEKWDESFPLIISGHIHDKQYVQPNLFYSGIPFTHNFGDKLDNIILEINQNNEIKEILTNLPFKKNLYFDFKDIELFEKNIKEYKDDENQYKFIIKGNENDLIFFREKYKHYFNIKNIKILCKINMLSESNLNKKIDNILKYNDLIKENISKENIKIQRLYEKLE